MTNEHEIALIYDRKNSETEEPLELEFLKVPSGYQVEKIVLPGNLNIAKGYNGAMRQTAARYKIYLQDGATIAHRGFLAEILVLFKKYPGLGLLGVIGAKRLPPNGIWWEAQETYGQINNQGKLIQGSGAIANDYAEVQAVDGIVMATQYDLPWREDLFSSRYFYDVAQSMEFRKAGYTVGVVKQTEPWIARTTPDDLILYQEYRRLFVKEYGEMLGGG